ncbi:MAG TPA: disulfide bond formation protein B [Burkholderiaceae bacterium]|nr:disulfide bond formation protein B [Burkholderiaceae bacterium]
MKLGSTLQALPRRAWFAFIALACASLLGYGLVLQHIEGLEPCPLCVLQRYGFVVLCVVAIVGALAPRLLGRPAAVVAILVALASAGVAAWHVHLQLNPPEFETCGPGLGTLISNFPLGRALPKIFQGSGECTQIDWRFLGLTIPGWSLIWFLVFGGASFAAARRAS